MNCCDIERFIDPYLDGEFDERERTEVEIHLGSCDSCRQMTDLQRALRHTVSVCGHETAPDALRDRIVDRLGLFDSEDSEAVDAHQPAVELAPDPAATATVTALDARRAARAGSWSNWAGWRYVSVAAAATVLLGLTGLGLATNGTTDNDGALYVGNLNSTLEANDTTGSTDRIIEETLDWHRRQLPMEVTGPSGDEVRGWFQGKLDFPVNMPRFSKRDVSVLGGRLAKVGDHEAALVTLEVNHRKLSMMVFPKPRPALHRKLATRATAPRVMMRTASGYNVAIVQEGDLAYSFVSDLPRPQLQQLVHRATNR